ncbi:MAG: putative Ig domain-containing protein, partial [Candidatus Zixiibacteriota bacterium]
MRTSLPLLLVLLFLFSGAMAKDFGDDAYAAVDSRAQSVFNEMKANFSNVQKFEVNGHTKRLYGQGFSSGYNAESSAENFRLNYAEVLSAKADELKPISPFRDKSNNTLPIMINPATGEPKFTIVYYSQYRDNIPVFRSELRLLVRHEANYPVVLAVSTLRNLGDFTTDKAGMADFNLARNAVNQDNSDLTEFSEPQMVIYAGIEDQKEKPRLAYSFVARNDFPQVWQYVVDIETSEILYKEDLIVFEDVTGKVQGLATEGSASEQCEFEIPTNIPYSKVSIGSNFSYTTSKGSYTVSNMGSDSVIIQSNLDGIYFDCYNYTGSEVLLKDTILPPGPANFMHNAANNLESVRSQVNSYYHANVVRDNVLAYVPNYPAVSTQTNFPIYNNRTDGYCPGNAWYDPGDESINFCSSGSGYPNTAWQSVIHHEYGHHLINMAGSGQGEYGEGMGDCIAMMWSDESELGVGFYGSCDEALRNADNTMQYPCSGTIHYCGQLLSGCVWETRNEMAITMPNDYLDTLRNLVFHSILLHTGTSIDPSITIDFLTLDDDDANLDNGTPHYAEICVGFGEHNMDCPDLSPVWFEYTSGRPEILYPGTSTTFEVVIHPSAVDPISGTGKVYYSVDGGAWTEGTMVETSLNTYDVTLPGGECNSTVRWYLSVETNGFGEVTNPQYAPSNYYSSFVATESINVFADDFESDMGWTVSGGSWSRGTPTGGGGQYGGPDPSSGHSGSNVFGYNLNGDYENSMPERHLTTPAIDCSELVNVKFSFFRWLGVEQPLYDHAYIRISNNGTSWTTLWQNEEETTDGSWIEMEFDISQYADGQPTVYLRWTMGTTDGSWQYCGWNIDDVIVTGFSCASTAPIITTESVPNWTVGIVYSQQLEAVSGTGVYTWADKNGDLAGTGLMLSSSGLLEGTPTSAGVISFTAEVTDETPESGEKLFNFTVNPAPTITTSTLPDWTAGYLFTQQLATTGGTGTIVWSDKNGELAGTGLVLSTTGLLTGTPATAGTISFTAMATDNVGAFDERPLSVLINPILDITTTSLPDGLTYNLYSEQLNSDGGTGTIIWSDKNNDLNGTDFTLSSTGLLSGTPQAPTTITLTARAVDAIGYSDEQLLAFVVNEGLIISTEQISNWTVGNPYSFQLESNGGLGVKTWGDKNGDLAGTGLTVSSDGLISGTPINAGDITFIAMVSDESKMTNEKEFTFTINPSLQIDTETLPNWTAGFPYLHQLTSSGGTGEVSWIDKNNGLFGFGLTLSTSGIISGSCMDGEAISFIAEASDQGGDSIEKQFDFFFNPPIQLAAPQITEVTVNAVYSSQLIGTGGTGILLWNDKNGSLAGSGLTLSTEGLLEGTPTVSGQINFIARAADEIGASKEINISITVNPAVNITSLSMPEWTVDYPYSYQVVYQGGTGAMTWDEVGLESTGLAIDQNGIVSGTPAIDGEVAFTVSLTDACGSYDEQTLSIMINPGVVITTEAVSDGKEDELYSAQLEATGGTGVKSWTNLNNDLSGTGLTLSEAGLLSGTPTVVGVITFLAEATDQIGSGDIKSLNINIAPAFICGDVNNNGVVNLLDITFIIAYLYKDGPSP